MNAFMQGLRSVRPDGKIKIVWINAWYDRARKATRRRRCSTRAATSSPSTPIRRRPADRRAARPQGFRPGQRHGEARAQGPADLVDRQLGPYYIERVKAALDGSWKAGDVWGGLAANCW